MGDQKFAAGKNHIPCTNEFNNERESRTQNLLHNNSTPLFVDGHTETMILADPRHLDKFLRIVFVAKSRSLSPIHIRDTLGSNKDMNWPNVDELGELFHPCDLHI